MNEKISILGGGSWGTALAKIVSDKGYNTKIWVRDSDQAIDMRQNRENKKYLPGVKFSQNLNVTYDLEYAISDIDILVLAVPTQAVRSVISKIKKHIRKDIIIVNVSKGVEIGTLLRISEIVGEELGDIDYVVLSGPSHAEEVGKGVPTTVVSSSRKKLVAQKIQDVFMTSRFRVYTNPDLVGVELGGAFKNIIALAAGISDGLGFGDNTKAALMNRGFVEIARIGKVLGAHSSTFSGLSGMGDLIVTCTSMHSRNRRAGILIGKGYSSDQVKKEIGMVVEGMKTTEAAYELSKKHGIDMPITEELYRVLNEGYSIEESMEKLMTRTKKNEMEELIGDEMEWLE